MAIGRKRKLDSSADARIKTKLIRTATNGQHEKHVSSDKIQNNVQLVDLDINNQPKQANDKLFHIQSIQGDKIGSIRKSQRIKFESWKLKEMHSSTIERTRKLVSSQITNKAEQFTSTISNHREKYSERMNSMHIRDSDIDVKPKRLEGKLIFTKTQQFNHNKIAVVRLPKIVGTSIKQRDNNVLSEFKMVAKDHLKYPKLNEKKCELQHTKKNTARSNADMESTSKAVVRSFPRIKIETTSANRIKENSAKLKTEIQVCILYEIIYSD